jgi:hypothetical protein
MRARGCRSIVNGSSKAGLSGAVSGITYTASEYLAYLLAIVTTDLLLAIQANLACWDRKECRLASNMDSMRLDMDALANATNPLFAFGFARPTPHSF